MLCKTKQSRDETVHSFRDLARMEFSNRILLPAAVIAAFCALPVLGVDNPVIPPTAFCYDDPKCGPATWGGLCATGRAQSPIDIDTLTNDPNFAEYFPFLLNDHYSREARHCFYGQNNGHTAQFEFSRNLSALTSDLEICGGNLPGCYNFAQLHFHWAEEDADGSEHTINGQRYPLELHLVHYKAKYSSLADALSHDDPSAVAVIAVLFEIGGYNRHMAPIVAALPSLLQPTGNVTDFHFVLRISDLIPHGQRDYARYYGSLTTPTCDEKVVWTVFLDAQTLTERQMDKFRALRNSEGVSDFNFRPMQPLNGRRVYIYRNVELNW